MEGAVMCWKRLGVEHVAAMIVAGVCLIVGSLLLGYALHAWQHAVAGVGAAFFLLMGWTALRVVTTDLRG
jgi:hypothetical protein